MLADVLIKFTTKRLVVAPSVGAECAIISCGSSGPLRPCAVSNSAFPYTVFSTRSGFECNVPFNVEMTVAGAGGCGG